MAYIDGQRLIKALAERPGHDDLIAAIRKALSPEAASNEFPKTMYVGSWDSYQSKTVANSAEEQGALAAGWSTAPAPAAPSRFPYRKTEKICPSNPSGKTTIIHDRTEEELFLAATDPNDWVADSLHGMYGGVRVSISQIVEERKAQVHAAIEAEPLAFLSPEIESEDDEESDDSSTGEQPLCADLP